MAKTKLPIHIYRGSKLLDDHSIMLGDAFLKRWKINDNSSVTLRLGAGKWNVRIIGVSGLTSMRISESLARQTGLTHGSQLCVQYRPGSRTLQLGPLLGVLVSRVYAGKSEAPFGAMTGFCKELTEACRLYGGYVMFFSPGELSSSDSLSAWTFNGSWSKGTAPLPDVVYNRLTTRRLENNPGVQQFMKVAKSRYGAVVFNEKYLNKTEVFEALKQDPALQAYLPESYPFKNYEMLKTMLERHPMVFLKPITGSLGKGIVRVSRTGAHIEVHATDMNGIRRSTFPGLSAAFKTIAGKLQQQKHQIQQGLLLMEVGERPVDFRALVQRGATGEWRITSIVARIAPGGSFVSNIARGGVLSSIKDAINRSNIPPGMRTGLITRLRKAALDIAAGIEARIPAHFGELGIDLAVDRRGKVWLLEVNSKPSKDDNTPLKEGKIRPSVRQLIEYSQYLANFKSTNG